MKNLAFVFLLVLVSTNVNAANTVKCDDFGNCRGYIDGKRVDVKNENQKRVKPFRRTI